MEKRKEYNKKYREENKEYIKELKKIYREKNRNSINEKQKKYREENKESISESKKKSYQKNKEHYLLHNKKNRQKIPNKIKQRLIGRIKRVTNSSCAGIYKINYLAIIQHLKPFPKDIRPYVIHHKIPLDRFTFFNSDGTKNKEAFEKAFAPENHEWMTIEAHKKLDHLKL